MDAQKFTEKSLSALENAHGEAVRLHNSELSTLHLLNALVTQENGLVPRIFEKIKLDGVKFSKTDSEITATYDKNKFKFDQIIDAVKNNAEILDISTDEGDLEDIFLKVTNK